MLHQGRTADHWPDDTALQAFSAVDDRLLQKIVMYCMQQQDTFIKIQQSMKGPRVVVFIHNDIPRSHSSGESNCPLLHIPLSGSDRSIGLCTDAALYMQLLGGWIVPAEERGLQHAQGCKHRSAVLFLEPLYEPWLDWLQAQQHVVAAYAPNFEHVFGYDAVLHKRVQLVLCKVHRCSDLMRRYLEDLGSFARVMYTGHTSIDPQLLAARATLKSSWLKSLARQQPAPMPSAPTPGANSTRSQAQPTTQTATQVLSTSGVNRGIALAAAVQPLSVLHVRGKSGLKHTKQLLDCWLLHPEWPQLTVVGPLPNEQISHSEAKRFMAAANIKVPRPGKPQGPNWPEFEPLSSAELAALLLSHAVHVMPSEREGFGHSINEGRAAGAVLVIPDHPPMNELVREGSGILLPPRLTFSREDPPVPALGKYGNISASMSPEGICAGVSQLLATKTPSELVQMGAKARALFEEDRADFVETMQGVRGLIQELLDVADAAAAEQTG